MGVDVSVITERGAVIRKVDDVGNVFAKVVTDYARSSEYLQFIDLYGMTYFNRLQIPGFIRELDEITKKLDSPSVIECLNEIRELAEVASAEYHRYLKFTGD